MKQFVKALDKDGPCFGYIRIKMPQISIEKLKAGIFDGPQIRQLTKDPAFVKSMNEIEKNSWLSFVEVIKHFLGNHKSENYLELVNNILTNIKSLGCNMSI